MPESNILRVSKNTAIYGLGSVSTQAVGMITLVLLTSHMRPDEFGVAAMLGILHLFLLPVFKLGMDTSVGMHYFDHDKPGRERLVWTAFVILATSALLMFLAGSLFSSGISSLLFKGKCAGGGLVVTQLAATALDIMILPLILSLQLNEKAPFFIGVNVAAAVILSGTQLLLVAVFNLGVAGWLAGLVIGKAFAFSMFFFSTFASARPAFSSRLAATLVRGGAPMIPSFAFLFILQNSGKYMLERMCGLGELGIFNVGFGIGSAMDLAVAAFCTAWFPFFQSFSGKKHEAGPLFGKITLYYVLSFSVVSMAFFAFARPFVQIFVNCSFLNSYKVIGLVSMASLASGFFYLLLPGVYYAKKVWVVNLTQGACSVLVLGLNYIFISWFDMTGVAMSLVCSYALMGFGQYFINRSMSLWSCSCEWGRVGSFLLRYLLFAFVLMVLGDVLSLPFYIASAPFILLAYCLVAWNFLDRGERAGMLKFLLELKGKFL